MNTVLFVNATIGFSENLFLVSGIVVQGSIIYSDRKEIAEYTKCVKYDKQLNTVQNQQL